MPILTPLRARIRAAGLSHCPSFRSAAAVGAMACAMLAQSGASAAAAGFRATPAVNGFQIEQLPAAQLGSQLASMQSDGVQVVRADAPWAQIQPNPPTATNPGWQWAKTDAWVAALASHRLTWEPILDYAVGWAKTCAGFCPPTNNSTFAAYAAAVASRYGAGGSFWAQNRSLPYEPAQIFEVWNEENVSTYRIPPAQYGPLYAATRTAIHAVEPSASVIVGGLADDSGTFSANTDYPGWYLVQMFGADPALLGHIDGFGLHPYGATAVDVEEWVVDFRRVLNVYGEGSAPIDITEVGWPAANAYRTAMLQNVALWLSRSNCGVRLLAPYDWMNPGLADPAADFGLVSPSSQTLTAAGTAWFAGLRRALSLPELSLCAVSAGAAAMSGSTTTTTTTSGSTTTDSGPPSNPGPPRRIGRVTYVTRAAPRRVSRAHRVHREHRRRHRHR